MTQSFLRYSPDVETVPPEEAGTIEAILESMRRLATRTPEEYGHAVRVSHAKSHGLAVGELEVLPGLPAHLAQGLFASPARYPVVARLANVPGEIITDAVSTQTGLSIKILGVRGEMLPGHEGEVTQDFVLDTGSRFAAADAKAFLLTHRALEHAPRIPDRMKEAVSKASRAANKALHALGTDSPKLDFFGHPRIHPLAEAYFTQAPIRYGEHVAKLAVVPATREQQSLAGGALDTDADENALRTATVSYLRARDAVFDIRVQLCTDLETMPVEDASREWDEERSPYQTVARLTFPRQEAYSEARRDHVDQNLAFCPSHGLAAHRPLGSIMRARLRAYPEMSRLRRQANGRPLAEPRSIDEIPA
ncbi:catalase family protein [Roseomonas sp. SSH11]|uniref:Catalase family protein n=1 Tax=Pararoseomonas baculiformis TaxID=2820812 RepID=A0ABS4AHE1_9PROT|nr:catalase family protein [Pararoseomonas baculiformis]MBP0446444.1 catalase family protein [Pararoseomonas baculiformis]